MTTIFAVIGESREDPDHLLVLGDDGQHDDYQLLAGTTSPVELTDDWAIDPCPPSLDEILA
jgi:hypothetical protein